MNDVDPEELIASINNRVTNFDSIVARIENLTEEKRVLYKEIYENAITDRQNACKLFRILVEICANNTTEHAVHGRTIATFIEKMSKANDQIIKLADLIRRAEEKNEEIDPDDVFRAINRR